MEKTSKRVFVIGAGVAGLAAARELARAGFCVSVLEARDRIGGRLFTLHDPATAVPVELGAEFVHGVHPALWSVLQEMHAPVIEVSGEHWTRDQHGLHSGSGEWEQMGRIFEAMSTAPEQSFAAFIAGVAAPPGAKRAATSYIEGFNAANRELVSVEWLNEEERVSEEIDGHRAFRILSGYDQVAKHLGAGLDIRLSTEVTRVRWTEGKVTIDSSRDTFEGEAVIIAVPFAILQDGRLRIEPEPDSLQTARQAIVTGNAIRVTFRFAEARWTELSPRLSFLHGDAAFPVWWTAFPVQTPVITGWAGGPKADRLAAASPDELEHIALDSLRDLLGKDPGQPQSAWLHDWRSDPFSLGAYSYVRVNGMPGQAALGQPFEKTIWFAGEALAGGHMGTVHGALASGITAARSVFGELG